MSSGCQVLSRAVYRPVGFGASFPPAGTLSANGLFISDGTQWVNYTAPKPGSAPWSNIVIQNGSGFPIYFSPANVAAVFKNFKNPQAAGPTIAWYSQTMVGTQDPGQVAITLNNFALKYGSFYPGSAFTYTGPSGLNNVGQPYGPVNNPFPSLAALAWGVQHGYLQITPAVAVAIQTNAVNQGIIPPSFWEYIGKPVLFIVAAIAGSVALGAAEGGTAAAGTGAGTGSGITTTGYTSANVSVATLQPIPTTGVFGTIPSAGFSPLTQTFTLVGGTGAGGGLLSGGGGALGLLSQGAGLASVGLKGAALLATLKAQGAQGATGAGPGGAQSTAQLAGTGAASPGKSALPLLIIGGAAAALFAFAHFV